MGEGGRESRGGELDREGEKERRRGNALHSINADIKPLREGGNGEKRGWEGGKEKQRKETERKREMERETEKKK